MTAEELIVRVERTVNQLLNEVDTLPQDVLYRPPSEGEWPVMSTLAHLAELLPYWSHEAADLAASPGKRVGRTHEDPDRLAAIAQHGNDSLAATVPRVRAALDDCIQTLRGIPADAWTATGQHVRGGQITPTELVERFVAHHAEEHAAQIQATLDTLRAARS